MPGTFLFVIIELKQYYIAGKTFMKNHHGVGRGGRFCFVLIGRFVIDSLIKCLSFNCSNKPSACPSERVCRTIVIA